MNAVLSVYVTGSHFITCPPTHSVVCQCCFARWRLSSSLSSVVDCNTPVCNVTYQRAARDGGPVVLHPVRAKFCLKCYFDKNEFVLTMTRFLTPVGIFY